MRLGIAPRLLIGLSGVAVLALAANFLVEQRILVKQTQITRIEPPPFVPVALTIPTAPAVAPAVDLRSSVSSEAFKSALERFGRAVAARVENRNDPADLEEDLAAKDLSRRLTMYVADVGALAVNLDIKGISAKVKAYETQGTELVQSADEGRRALTTYETSFESLNARVKHSLGGAWTILGRVVARQSLLRLSEDLDTLRTNSVTLAAKKSVDPAALAALANSEDTLSKTLAGNEKGFRRSQGDAWFEAMQEDLGKLVAARKSVLLLSREVHAQTEAFGADGSTLAQMIPGKIEGRVRAHAARSVEPVAPAEPPRATSEAEPQISAAPVPISHTQSFTETTPQDTSRKHWLAWISAVTIAVLIYLCVGTVLSVVRPIRGLLTATTRIASGDHQARVERGGIKELDVLAQAFNSMAEELGKAKAVVQEYQLNLEAKVVERTQQLQDLAERDPLTGLPNRRQLFDLLNRAIDNARERGRLVAVFFLDIDNFKYINDSLGHAFGDRVLVSLSDRLLEACRPFGFAARLGGDEFTVIYEAAGTAEEIRTAGLRVVQAFQQPLSVDGRDLIVSVSVGASIYPDHEQDAEALLQAADAALFRAKKLGRSQLSVFTPDLLETAAANFTTEQGLRRAIERGEFELVFQPEISVETMETCLVEALIRWRLPDGSLVSPGQFLAVAEESGLIIQISDWVLRSAIEAASVWHHGAWPEARVAINVSPRQLFDNQFVDRLQGLLDEYRLPARCIEIELTESVLQTGPTTVDALRQLRDKGIAIALDDFGTGYSSLASLEQLPLNRIKLDRSLIAGMGTISRSAAITRAIIGMCQGLGLEITAEGVERPEQFEALLGHRSMHLQGYLLCPPVARDTLLAAIAQASARAKELLLLSSSAPSRETAVSARKTA
jgi:diguanylate cyclase (GGDEF)-like protein